MGGVEVEQAVVEDHVVAASGILNPDGGMAVKLVDGFAGLTGKKVCVYAVILCLGSRNKEHEGGQNGE